VGHTINRSIGTEANFSLETCVFNGREHLKIGGPGKRNAVLFNVGGILGRVEFDLHVNRCTPNK